MTKPFARLTAGAALACLVTGCQTFAVAPDAKDVDPRLKASAVKGDAAAVDLSRAQPIEFAGARLSVPRTRVVAEGRGNLSLTCVGLGPRRYTVADLWKPGSGLLGLRAGFSGAMVSAGLKVPSVSGSVFAANRSRAPFRVGATVTDIKLRICAASSAWDGRFVGFIAAGSVTVKFEVYSLLAARVVYTTSVIGGGRENRPSRQGIHKAFESAFIDAAARLARDPGFISAISTDATKANAGGGSGGGATGANETGAAVASAGPPAGTPIRLIPAGAVGGPIVGNMNRIRRATVVVSFSGHGSGFLIDRRGYVLTNAHVVGDSPRVRVRLFQGKTVIGRVVRRDEARDVALVKIPPPGRAPLPLRRVRARVGEDVFAVGAPTGEYLEATVSRGVVGALRRFRGQTYIQADASVHPGSSGGPLVDRSGNVIGLTVSALRGRDGRQAAGLNLFIPIGDALRRLNLHY